jgi:hypothetical protein
MGGGVVSVVRTGDEKKRLETEQSK